jgi:hypothetical protein
MVEKGVSNNALFLCLDITNKAGSRELTAWHMDQSSWVMVSSGSLGVIRDAAADSQYNK